MEKKGDKVDKHKTLREWINTTAAIGTVLLLAYGIIWGVGELQDVNVKLDNLKKINLSEVALIDENGSVYGIITPEGIHLRSGAAYKVGDLNIDDYK